MRDKQRRRTAILVTDDPAVEAAARDVADEMGDLLHLIKANDDATSAAFDASAVDSFAIVDIDTHFGTRSMFNTIAGLLPVIAVTRKRKPWLQTTMRRHPGGVSLMKPITREDLRMACSERETSISTVHPTKGATRPRTPQTHES